MAHSPEKKAEAIADIANGMTYQAACKKHGVSRATLDLWVRTTNVQFDKKTRQKSDNANVSKPVKIQAIESKHDRFNKALDQFLYSTIQMLQRWAETCSDPKFITQNPDGVNELGKTVLDRADRLVSTLGGRAESDQAKNESDEASG